jgi:hypothetical protein
MVTIIAATNITGIHITNMIGTRSMSVGTATSMIRNRAGLLLTSLPLILICIVILDCLMLFAMPALLFVFYICLRVLDPPAKATRLRVWESA